MIGPKMPRQKEAPIMDFLPEFPRPIYQNRSQNLLGKLKPWYNEQVRQNLFVH